MLIFILQYVDDHPWLVLLESISGAVNGMHIHTHTYCLNPPPTPLNPPSPQPPPPPHTPSPQPTPPTPRVDFDCFVYIFKLFLLNGPHSANYYDRLVSPWKLQLFLGCLCQWLFLLNLIFWLPETSKFSFIICLPPEMFLLLDVLTWYLNAYVTVIYVILVVFTRIYRALEF